MKLQELDHHYDGGGDGGGGDGDGGDDGDGGYDDDGGLGDEVKEQEKVTKSLNCHHLHEGNVAKWMKDELA